MLKYGIAYGRFRFIYVTDVFSIVLSSLIPITVRAQGNIQTKKNQYKLFKKHSSSTVGDLIFQSLKYSE